MDDPFCNNHADFFNDAVQFVHFRSDENKFHALN